MKKLVLVIVILLVAIVAIITTIIINKRTESSADCFKEGERFGVFPIAADDKTEYKKCCEGLTPYPDPKVIDAAVCKRN